MDGAPAVRGADGASILQMNDEGTLLLRHRRESGDWTVGHDIALEDRLAALETRLRAAEDRLAIMDVVAHYGPAVDTRSATATADLWTQDGVYDYGAAPLVGTRAIGGLVDREPHVSYVERGCAHVMSMPAIAIEGDRAVAVNYSRLYVRDGERWAVERASANRWQLVRTASGWKVESRLNRPLDGSTPPRELLDHANGRDEA